MSTPLTEQLKPCPFCGSHDIDESYAVVESSGERHESPGCMNCGAMADTIELWNTRADERKLAAAREALTFALAKEECDMSDAEQCGGWDDVDWLNAHARANRYRAALASIENSSPQTTEKPNHQ